ncbi:hypothetical protein TW95_gp1347 [Pandoravirus inopinatum]|uniref:Uncharacterized protein n=1 Tax=Pandoravirus inopinatum TaxID=1605721 RepID=A0A0B5JAS2_9VIRU|nr:hypothetical protein TW95_gp1347 [Pandoravirus inopinatum]AJF98081.1 hypothetical protein [Pandoravirus inopinatum]
MAPPSNLLPVQYKKYILLRRRLSIFGQNLVLFSIVPWARAMCAARRARAVLACFSFGLGPLSPFFSDGRSLLCPFFRRHSTPIAVTETTWTNKEAMQKPARTGQSFF